MLLNINDWVNKSVILGTYLPKITSPSLRLKNGSYDDKGLYSTEFFGQQGSDKWKQMYSVIELPHPILHPAIYYIVDRRISQIQKWLNLSIGGQFENKELIITNDSNKYDMCGLADLYDNSELISNLLIDSGKIETKAGKVILNKVIKKDPLIWTSYIIVPPPLYRPNDEDNELFVKIIGEIQILRSAMLNKDKILKNRLLFSIQNLQNEIFNSMIGKVKGKTGLIRGSMLGRNADFSGRAVIVGDPQLDADHLGVPKTMLVRLFYPWIINYILKNKTIAYELSKYVPVNKPALHTLINDKLLNEDIDSKVMDILYAVTAEVIKDKVVIAKRDPSLHKLSVRAYYPVMVDDSSIHISPSVCPGHNADFDGDQMAIFIPLSEESQKEAKEKMLPSNNLWNPQSGLSLVLEKDFPASLYFITKNVSSSPIKKINNDIDIFGMIEQVTDFSQKIEYKGRVNTIGRRIFELIFEDKIKIDEPIMKKLLGDTLERFANQNVEGKWLVERIFKIQQVCSIVSSIMGGDISIDSFKLPPDLEKRRQDVFANLNKYDVSKELKDISDEFVKRSDNNGQYGALVRNSGLTKTDFQQISVAKGYISDVYGNTDPNPIKSNFVDGFSSTDYFKSASGSRKGVVDRVMNTAKSGYLMRQMAYLMAPLKAGKVHFCGTKKLVEVVLTEDLIDVLVDRVLESGETLTKELAKTKNLYNKPIKYYSPMYCKSKDLCSYCYPAQFRRMVNNVQNVGIIAAQAVGERCTQLIMRSFHCSLIYSLLIIKKDNVISNITFKEFWNSILNGVILDTDEMGNQEYKNVSDYEVWDNGNWTKINKIIRHKRFEESPMVFYRTKNSKYFGVCQDNHPIMATRDDGLTFEPVEVKNLIGSDYKVKIDSTLWDQTENYTPEYDPYFIGMFIAEGSISYQPDSHGVSRSTGICISQHTDSICYDKCVELMTDINTYPKNNDLRYIDKGNILYRAGVEFSIKMEKDFGRYSKGFHIPFDYIHYSDEDLAKILCGFIDGDGSVYQKSDGTINHTNISIEISSYTMIVQLCQILRKFNIRFNIIPCSIRKLTRNQTYVINISMYESYREYLKYSIKVEKLGKFGKDNPYLMNTFYDTVLDTVDYIKPIYFNDNDGEDGLVYDLETESHTFTVNGIWNHNTGGGSKIVYLATDCPETVDYIDQNGLELFAKVPLTIKLRNANLETANTYVSRNFELIINNEPISVEFSAQIEFDGLSASKVSDANSKLIILEYDEGSMIGQINSAAADVTSATMLLQSIMDHADEFETPEQMVMELYETFKLAGKVPMLYLEMLVSQMIRDPERMYRPYRLGPMDKPPTFVGIKRVAALENPIRGIMFERISDVLINSVINDYDYDKDIPKSDLEDLFRL